MYKRYNRPARVNIPADYSGNAFSLESSSQESSFSESTRNVGQRQAFYQERAGNQSRTAFYDGAEINPREYDSAGMPAYSAQKGEQAYSGTRHNPAFSGKKNAYQSSSCMPVKHYREGREYPGSEVYQEEEQGIKIEGECTEDLCIDGLCDANDSNESLGGNECLCEGEPDKNDGVKKLFDDYSLEDILLIGLLLLLVSGKADDEVILIIGLLLLITSG